MDLLERPKEITNILISLKYWDKKNLVLFLDNFIQDNCDKISFVLSNTQIKDNLNSMTENELKSNIISLLQQVKSLDEISLPKNLVP